MVKNKKGYTIGLKKLIILAMLSGTIISVAFVSIFMIDKKNAQNEVVNTVVAEHTFDIMLFSSIVFFVIIVLLPVFIRNRKKNK